VYRPFCANTIRDKKTTLPFTTLYYNNLQSYMFQLYETNNVRIHAAVFPVVCTARAVRIPFFFWYVFLKREADYGCRLQPHVALWIIIIKCGVCTVCVTATELIFSGCRSWPFTHYQNCQRNRLDTNDTEAVLSTLISQTQGISTRSF
jgi:hypothetical protein